MTTREEVAAILAGWSDVRVQDFGAFWRVAGVDLSGVPHSGVSPDPRELAERLAALAIAAPAVNEPEQPTRDLAAERARLLQALLAEAARRAHQPVELYQIVTTLAAIPEQSRTPDEQLQLLQHANWAAAREAVEAVRRAKADEIAALTTLAAIDAYDVTAGWPA
jgi:hypothetical protein